jgi:two-component system chemotaxis response regulator CheB
VSKIRTLVVDDSVVIRRLLSDCLTGDAEIEVVAAASGRIALAKIPQINPDVVTLDVEMPDMNGLETLVEIRKLYPKLPVIMFSTLTERGGAATLDALSLGANDYVTKPANAGSVTIALQRVRDDLIPKIKALSGRAPGPVAPAAARVTPITTPPRRGAAPGRQELIDVVAIGVSTGGPNALAAMFPDLPAELPTPIVIVQHMPPLFTRLLAERLDARSGLAVREGTERGTLRPGEAWIAPGGRHMTVAHTLGGGGEIRLGDGPPENSCRPAVDVLFRSVVAAYGPRVLGVVLTGMGQDGLRGCERIREAGGQVIVQDEASSVVWGMPGFVARAGLADAILPLESISGEIVRRVWAGRAKPLTAHEAR